MPISQLSAGVDVPNDMNVIIEIAAQSDPVKYEVDKGTGLLHVDRFVATAMRYPCNYGYIPGTHSEDGDALDVLVVTPFPLVGGSVIRVRPVGLLVMEDEAGQDNKILSVPVDRLSTLYHHIQAPADLPQVLLDRIVHFFEHYKDLESGKWVKLKGWEGVDKAAEAIMRSIERYQELEGTANATA